MVKDSLTDFLSTITFTSVWASYFCRPKHSGCRDAEWPVRRELGWEKSLQQHLNWNQREDTAREQLDGAVDRQVKRQLGHTHFVNHNNPVSNCRSNAVLIEGRKKIKHRKKSGHSEAEQRVRSYSATRNDTYMFHRRCNLTNSFIIFGDA